MSCERKAASVGKTAITPRKVRIEVDRLLKEFLGQAVVLARGYAEMPFAPAIADAEQQRAMRKPPGSLDAWTADQRGLLAIATASVISSCTAKMSAR